MSLKSIIDLGQHVEHITDIEYMLPSLPKPRGGDMQYRLSLFVALFVVFSPFISKAQETPTQCQVGYVLQQNDNISVEEIIKLYTECFSFEMSDEDKYATYVNRGVAYTQIGKTELAIMDYSEAISIFKDDYLVYFNRGNLFRKIGKCDLAIEDYNNAILLNPLHAGSYSNKGLCYYKNEQYDIAVQEFNKALQIESPYVGIVYFNRAQAYKQLGRYQEAIEDYSKNIELVPGDAQAYIYRATAFELNGQYGKAAEDYTKALSLDSGAATYNAVAWFYSTCSDASSRDGQLAVKYALMSVAISKDENNLDTLAAAYACTGQFDLAVKTQKEAIAELNRKEYDLKTVADYESRLDLYRQGRPYFEQP